MAALTPSLRDFYLICRAADFGRPFATLLPLYLFAGLAIVSLGLAGCADNDPAASSSSVTSSTVSETASTMSERVPESREDAAKAQADGDGAHSPKVFDTYSRGLSRGLWVLAEGSQRVLGDAERIDPLLARAERLGATDLFVQVYRGGRAFYPAGPGIERADGAEADVLAELLRRAHAAGFRVHAWVNVLSLSTRADAKMIEDLGREAILVDRLGRSVLDYPDFEIPQPDRQYYRMGTRGIYLDPAHPAVRERIVMTYLDLLKRYPALDGLHLDYIRHPGVLPFSPGSRFGVGLEFGYGATSRARYRAETGRPDPIEGAPPGVVRAASAWDDWRRHQVTTLVEEISAVTHAARPGLVLSAAVIAYMDRAYLSLAQDWKGWLESGALDLAIPMVYTLDDRLLRYQVEDYAGWKEAARIWPGVGVWLFDDHPERAVGQIEILRDNAFSGEVLFSDDALATAPELERALAGPLPSRSSLLSSPNARGESDARHSKGQRDPVDAEE